ncbi:MAG: hypothetical protein ED559_11460 [Phycisphaera sp.]|nr:MAG: hypothetical protein ED559_11460 [Phycisphaera sp.]
MSSTIISDRVALAREGCHPALLAQISSGFAVLNDNQPVAIEGCCVLLPDPVVPSVNDMSANQRAGFMSDLLMLGDAVLAATGAERINYLILCNMAPELHAHVIPRFATEDPKCRRLGPFEAYDFASAPACEPDASHRELLSSIRGELVRLGAAR